MPLITEGGINRINDGFIEISIRIDNDRIFPAHFADNVLEFALTGPRFAGRFPNFETDFTRASERDHIDVFMVDKMSAND